MGIGIINMNNTFYNAFRLIVLCISISIVGQAFTPLLAQDRCGTVEYEQQIRNQLKKPESKKEFEEWLQQRIFHKKNEKQVQNRKAGIEAVVQIPVVVHIIHNGESIGNGTNISDAQIQSQIDVLNEDFRRTNADKSATPSDFLGVASDTEVEFVMAQRDPEGLATNGIIRVEGSQSSWSMSDNVTLKALSYWPAEDYLNMWVTQLSSPLIGYAQFPVSSLEGLEDSSDNRLTDGVVMDYEVFGSIDKYPQASLKSGLDKGRTTTHEIGHFLGLRHIWGDGDCSKDDFCNDTPAAGTDHNGQSNCSYPGANTCNEGAGDLPDMFQNYMDYTDDGCMNLFTEDQKERIIVVLENSPRRSSLTTSLGGTSPTIFDNDLGIYQIISPGTYSCGEETVPQVVIKNYGNNTATEVTLTVSLDGAELENISFTLNLDYLESTTLSLNSLPIDISTNHEFNIEITWVNNTVDDNAINNIKSVSIVALPTAELPLGELLNKTSEVWEVNNPDGAKGWELQQLSYKSPGDSVLFLDFYEYDIEGEQDWFISPLLDFTNSSVAALTFEIAHARYSGNDDRLKVMISTDCGNTYLQENTVYDKSGDDLATAGTSASPFVPGSADQWRLEQIDLSAFAGQTVRIAFVGVNGYGNNLYLDNINITGQTTKVNTPYPVSGVLVQPFNIDVFNASADTIKNLTINYALNDGLLNSDISSGINLGPGQVANLDLSNLASQDGFNSVYISLSSPDGPIETGLEENEIIYSYIVDHKTDIIPLREDFTNESEWIGINPVESEIEWEELPYDGSFALWVNSFDHSTQSSNAWYVSPALDLSGNTVASLFFDISYAASVKGSPEKLTILISIDNGLTYPYQVYAKSGEVLTTHNPMDNWVPKDDADWRTEFINLTDFVGNTEVRVAFVLQNNYGNNIYLDNIEFYEDNNPEPISLANREVYAYPNPIKSGQDALELVFDLKVRQPVEIAIYDRVGKPIFEGSVLNALNQHYTFTIEDIPTGLFILYVRGTTFNYSQRLVVIR